MRQKKAKHLKKMVKQKMQGIPWATHTEVNKHWKSYGVDFISGEPLVAEVSTVMLDACQKATYKELKNNYKKGLTGLKFNV